MKIHGLQKMTLLDYPGHVACTVFLGQCDFRCPYCHNYELVDGSAPACMGSDELFAFLKKRQGLLDGVAITGGEPCLHKGLYDLIIEIRKLGFAVKLDTNGNHPALLSKLLDGHLVDFDEAITRGGMYKAFERHAHEETCRLFQKEVQ